MPEGTLIKAMQEQRQRDWISVFGPTVLAVCVSLGIQLSATAWYFGSLNTRVTNIEARERQFELDSRQLSKDDNTVRDSQQQELNLRLNRMDDKLDRLIESQRRER